MTIETKTRDVLLRAADDIDVAPPPIDALLGAPARRRRRIAGVVAGLSAAAVVVAVAVISAGSSDSGAPPVTSAPTPPTTAPGTRLVGLNGVMVSVPEGWTSTAAICPPAEDQVVFDSTESLKARCLFRTASGASLHLAGAGHAMRASKQVHAPTLRVSVDGLAAYRRTSHYAPPCDEAAACDDRYLGALYIPSLGVTLVVSSPDNGVVDPILDSAHLIPDGYVATPPNASASELAALGLTVESESTLSPDRIVQTDPPMGSVVAVGSTVTVGSPTPVDPSSVAHPIAAIVKAHGVCGATGGFAVDVTIRTEQRFNTLVLLLVRGDIVGKVDAVLVPGRLNHVVVQQDQPKASRSVTIKVVQRVFGPSATLARLPHIPRSLPQGTVCY